MSAATACAVCPPGHVHSTTPPPASTSSGAPFLFKNLEQLALLVVTAALSVTAFQKDVRSATLGFALGAGLASFGKVRRMFVTANSGCGSSAGTLTQSDIPWPIGVTVFWGMTNHHLKHHPNSLEIGMITLGLAVQLVHLFQIVFFPTGEDGFVFFSQKQTVSSLGSPGAEHQVK